MDGMNDRVNNQNEEVAEAVAEEVAETAEVAEATEAAPEAVAEESVAEEAVAEESVAEQTVETDSADTDDSRADEFSEEVMEVALSEDAPVAEEVKDDDYLSGLTAAQKKRREIFDHITTGILIFLLASPVLILLYIFLWFILR